MTQTAHVLVSRGKDQSFSHTSICASSSSPLTAQEGSQGPVVHASTPSPARAQHCMTLPESPECLQIAVILYHLLINKQNYFLHS